MSSLISSGKSRRVSIASAQLPTGAPPVSTAPKPLLSKSNSVAGSANISSAIRKVTPAPVLESAKPAALPEHVILRKEKEQLEQQLIAQKKATQASEERNVQLGSHIAVLEDLLEQKKSYLESVETKMEELGLDPIAVAPFQSDDSEERRDHIAKMEQEFEDRIHFLKEGVQMRRAMLRESLNQLEQISNVLESLESE